MASMKLTTHQESIMLLMATRYKDHKQYWVKPIEVSRFCGTNYSQCQNSSWSLPKLRSLMKKGLLHMDTYQNAMGGADAYMFRLNPETKTAFQLLLRV